MDSDSNAEGMVITINKSELINTTYVLKFMINIYYKYS